MLQHQFARRLRNNASKAQQVLWYYLRRRQQNGLKFRREHPIGPYIVDFICLEKNLIIEIDGGQHAVQVKKDTHRTLRLESLGYKVLRFWNNEVLVNTEEVLEIIQRHL